MLCKEGSVTMQMDGNDFELKKDDLYIYPAFSKTIITKCSDDFAAIGSAAESRYSFTLLKSMPGDSQCMAHIRFKPQVSLQEDVAQEIEKLFNHVVERKKKPTRDERTGNRGFGTGSVLRDSDRVYGLPAQNCRTAEPDG